jgi:DNA-binding transcriptional MerR regulator
MFSIGEFSRLSGLTVKTLRFYHEQGILVPSRVEAGSGYRFYAEAKIETARVITTLRNLEFSIAEISEILSSHEDDANILMLLEARKTEIQARIKDDRQLVRLLDKIITNEREAIETMADSAYSVEEKIADTILVASMRMTGKYSDCGKGFGKVARSFGRQICGKAMMLCHDDEYQADNASFEVAIPIKHGKSTEEIQVKELSGGRCLSLMHLGPYDELKRSYAVILKFAADHGMQYAIPTREIYHKGPGVIFRGNPKKYLTEIQLMLT